MFVHKSCYIFVVIHETLHSKLQLVIQRKFFTREVPIRRSFQCAAFSLTSFLHTTSDGLTDCEDPECCENPVCRKSQLCHTVPYPIDILLRKQPPSSTASFFERMKFIIEDKGLQSYVERAGFNERYS